MQVPKIRALNISYCTIDGDLGAVGKYTGLQSLSLVECQLNSKHLSELASCIEESKVNQPNLAKFSFIVFNTVQS